MDGNKQLQEASLIGRLLSMEALLMLMGIASLLYGISKGAFLNILCGLIMIPGVFLIFKARQKRQSQKNNQSLS